MSRYQPLTRGVLLDAARSQAKRLRDEADDLEKWADELAGDTDATDQQFDVLRHYLVYANLPQKA